ncbi:MAG: mannosyltransferase family protein [Patescibacteria group bacterium]
MKELPKSELPSVIKITFWWRIGLFLLGLISTSLIGFLFPYPSFQRLIELGNGIPSIWSWGGFDGVHYLTISESGYVADFTQAFFPFFPWVIGIFSKYLSLNSLYSALLVGNLSLLVVTCLFWLLLRIDFKAGQSRQIILSLLFFPTAFFFGAVYGESFFLSLVFGSFLAARKKKWLLAGVIGAMATATRFVGIFLIPALVVEYWLQLKESGKSIKSGKFSAVIPVLSICIVSFGLIAYMVYSQQHFNDALKFIHSQPAFGASRSDKIILLYQVFWRYAKMAVTVDFFSLLYYRISMEVLSAVIFLILGLISFKNTRLSYAIFGFLSFLAPTLTGTFSSMPRYILVMFPVFIMIGSWLNGENHKFRRWIYYSVSTVLLTINTMLFLGGRFLA